MNTFNRLFSGIPNHDCEAQAAFNKVENNYSIIRCVNLSHPIIDIPIAKMSILRYVLHNAMIANTHDSGIEEIDKYRYVYESALIPYSNKTLSGVIEYKTLTTVINAVFTPEAVNNGLHSLYNYNYQKVPLISNDLHRVKFHNEEYYISNGIIVDKCLNFLVDVVIRVWTAFPEGDLTVYYQPVIKVDKTIRQTSLKSLVARLFNLQNSCDVIAMDIDSGSIGYRQVKMSSGVDIEYVSLGILNHQVEDGNRRKGNLNTFDFNLGDMYDHCKLYDTEQLSRDMEELHSQASVAELI